MANRWFLVPVVTGIYPAGYPVDTDADPKYHDTTGIDGYAGQQVTINGTDYFVVQFRGTTSALDTIESNTDATSMQEAGLSESDVAGYLNDVTGNSYTFDQWEQRFLTT